MFAVGDIVNSGILNGVIKSIHYNDVTPIHYLITYPCITSNYVDQWISAERLMTYNMDIIRGSRLDELGV